MKTRNGFVSNSSSSSFVVSVGNTPEQINNLLMHILGLTISTNKEELMENLYPEYDEGGQYLALETLQALENGDAVINFVVDWGDDTAWSAMNDDNCMQDLGAQFIGDMYS